MARPDRNTVRTGHACAHSRALRCAAALLPLLLAGGSAHAAIFTVGTGTGCSHGTIQAAINAANASAGADTVRLTRSLTYEPESNSVVTSQDLNIVGGFATCQQAASDGIKTVVSGGLNNGGPVFSITANGSAIIKLRHLDIMRAQARGIAFSGNGILQVIESTIELNRGGGISAHATGSNAELVIDTGTLITYNGSTQFYGGGVYLTGPIEMTMTAPETMIAFNSAGGDGGGLYIGPGAYAYIGSPGWSGLPAIYANDAAATGGGVYNGGTLKLFSTDPSQPVGVVGNSSSWGGGIESLGTTCAWDARIDDNTASGRGGAMHVSGALIMNRDGFLECVPHPAAQHCAAGAACTSISGNVAQNEDGSPADTGALHFDDGYMSARNLRMQDNSGTYTLYGLDSDINLHECLITDNLASSMLLVAEGSATIGNALLVDSCTLSHNAIGSTVVYSTNYLWLASSIIDQPGRGITYLGSAGMLAGHLVVAETAGLPASPTILQADPKFIAPAARDYRLYFLSPAVDFAPAGGFTDFDIDGNPRNVDLVSQGNNYGPRDVGAYERQQGPWNCGSSDAIFCDGFES